MAVPFRRKSSSKSKKGRSVKNLNSAKNMFLKTIKCENCEEKKVIHEVCKKCLNYRNLDFNKKKNGTSLS
ncbi:MAG TPA: 50S ribosomal protein L32 [Mycoplasmatales bacterium]|jgi:ribosomal protein L32|nr:50S ribosomal protein L32 [Mycoplasmatales bacterium]